MPLSRFKGAKSPQITPVCYNAHKECCNLIMIISNYLEIVKYLPAQTIENRLSLLCDCGACAALGSLKILCMRKEFHSKKDWTEVNRDDKSKYIGKIREYRANAGFSYGEVFCRRVMTLSSSKNTEAWIFRKCVVFTCFADIYKEWRQRAICSVS